MSTLKKVSAVAVFLVILPLLGILVDITFNYGRLIGTIGRIISSM